MSPKDSREDGIGFTLLTPEDYLENWEQTVVVLMPRAMWL